MELTKEQLKRTKGVALIFMIILHLFCRKEIDGYYNAYLYINNTPVIYYLALLGGAVYQYIVLVVDMDYILDIRIKI